MVEATRTSPLADRLFGGNSVQISPLPDLERIVVRSDEKSVAALSKAIGVKLPLKPNTSAIAGETAALWVGPDEWFVTAPEGSDLEAKANSAKGLYSIVSVNHRNTGLMVSGSKAVLALNSGCPRDLSLEAFPIGACARTMLGKAEIILWRSQENEFRVECWRSFSDYVWKYMQSAVRSA